MQISVVIPALNEAANIASVIRLAAQCRLVNEIVVVDDGSIDDTRGEAERAGARVVNGSLLGKGSAMEDGLQAATGELIVYLDGDLRGLRQDLIERLVEPLGAGRADFVKAKFSREAGRVTVLTARPLLATFFPELASIAQPLGGLIAVRRRLLEQLHFETDYGVDLALLIDAHFAGARIEEVEIGHLEHESQTLDALGEMAKQVVRVLMHRAQRHGRFSIEQVQEVEEVERQAQAEVSVTLQRVNGAAKLALFDMDGTLLRGRTVIELAERTGRADRIQAYLDRPEFTATERTRRIAACLEGVPREEFVAVARSLPLAEGAAETVIALRREGYLVGIVSDSFRQITDIVRRRVFADFSVANLLRFRRGVCTGEVSLSPLFTHPRGCEEHAVCKWSVLLHLEERFNVPRANVLAVGDNLNDACLLRQAGLGIAYEPKASGVVRAADVVLRGDLRQVLRCAWRWRERRRMAVEPELAFAES